MKLFESLFSDSRKECVNESKQNFITAYKMRCLEIIKEIESEKGGSFTLICDEGTKQNPQCEQYCERKAEKTYSKYPYPNPDKIINKAVAIFRSN